MGRTRLRYCLNGHDTWECGRYPKSGRCRQCQRDSSRESKHNRKMEHLPLEAARAGLRAAGTPRLPWEPLRAELVAAGLLDHVSTHCRRDWGRRGIPPNTADDLICRLLGSHPDEIYGEAWWAI